MDQLMMSPLDRIKNCIEIGQSFVLQGGAGNRQKPGPILRRRRKEQIRPPSREIPHAIRTTFLFFVPATLFRTLSTFAVLLSFDRL